MRVLCIDQFVDLDAVRALTQGAHTFSENGSLSDHKDVDVILTAGEGIPVESLESFPRLVEIITAGSGVDHLDVSGLRDAGIKVTNVPDYCTEEVSDHAVALACALFRSLPVFLQHPQEAWVSPKGVGVRRFSSVQVGVLGTGKIGRAVSRKLTALGMSVVMARRPQSRHQIEAVPGAEVAELGHILPSVDLLVVAAPGNLQEAPVLNADALKRMRKGAFLVNVSRASLVDLSVMRELLRTGHLAGAYFDVWDSEPPLELEALTEVPGLFLSPHSGWYSPESESSLWALIAERLDRLAAEPR